MERTLDKVLLVGIGLVVVLLVGNAALAYRNTRQLLEDAAWVAHTHEVLDRTSDVLRSLVDAETGQRGFLITGKEDFLELYHQALARLGQQLQTLKDKTQDNPRQQDRIGELEKRAADRLALLEKGIDLRRHSAEEAQALVATGQGKAKMDAIRRLITSMEDEEHDLLRDRERQSAAAYRTAVTTELIAAALGLALVGALVYLVRRRLRERSRAAAQVHEERQRLHTTLTSIGDAVIVTDAGGRVTLMNRVAQDLTGWKDGAGGQPLGEVFRIVNEQTRQPVESPVTKVIREGVVVGLANHTVLLAKDGGEVPIDDSGAPFRNAGGDIIGVVLVFRDVTERRRLERLQRDLQGELERQVRERTAELRASEERFRLLVEGTRDYAIFLLDRTGHVVSWNPGAERIKGYRADEIIGQNFSRFYPQEAIDRGWPAHELSVAATEGRFEDEGWRVRKDGSRFWANVIITALRDESGNLWGFSKITRDLTERKQAEESARRLAEEQAARKAAEEYAQVIDRQREQLRVTLTSIGDAVITTDAEGRVTLLNPIAEALTAWTNEAAIGQPLPAVFRIVNEKTKQTVENPVAKVLATGRIVGLANHTELIAKDGTERAIDDSGAPIRDRQGNVAGVVLVFRDVTQQRKAERSARFLASIIESSDDAIIGKDMQGRITSWNRGAERIFGYSAAEAVGRPIAMLAPSDRADEMPAILDRIKRGERIEHFNTVRCAKDGRPVPISLTVSPIKDEDGTIIGASKIARDITERKWADEALRQQREWLRVTLASIGDAAITTDTQGRVTFLNPVAESLTGWGQEQAHGQPLEAVFPILHEQTRSPVENPVAKVIREGVIVGLGNHTVLVARGGTERPIDDSAAPIRGDQGETVGVVLIFRDVTEQRQAQLALRQSEARKTAILDTALDGIITIDHEGKVVEFNPAAERTFGYRRADVLGRPMAELIIPPNLREKHYRGLAHYLATGVGPVLDKRLEMPALRADGTEVPVELAITRISAEGPPLFTAYLRDITERKRAEQAARFLADASKSLAALVDDGSTMQKVARLAVPSFADWCAVDLLEPDGSLQRVAVAHVDPSKVELAHALHRRYPPDPDAPQGVPHILRTGKPELIAEITDALLVETVKDKELLRILRELGLKSYLGVPLQARGKTVGAITFVAAESGRRFDAIDLGVAEELAHRAGIAMENARLYGEVREADRRKDEFLAMLAHELRNPLAPIRNALHIMKQAGADAAVVGQVREMMERQVQHMTRMVDDLLDVSRITRGKIELRKEAVDLATVVGRTVEATRPLIEDRQQELTVDLPPDPVRLEADPTRLEQVLANLLNNAAKYTDHEGHIGLYARREGGELVLRVRDTGVGIAPEMLPRIFEPFVQADRVLHHSQGGLGIGLTLVRRLVEMHGGSVAAHSEGPGQGSEFVVRLPALSPKQTIPGEPSAGEGGTPFGAAPQRRILGVDDNVDAAESLALLLRLEGHDVRVAHDGPAALTAVEAEPPDLVFLDIGMPVMNGYDVARRLRQRPGLQKVVLVAMTGWGQEEDRRRSQEAGFDHHLIKPVEPEALRKLLSMRSP